MGLNLGANERVSHAENQLDFSNLRGGYLWLGTVARGRAQLPTSGRSRLTAAVRIGQAKVGGGP